MNRQHNIEIFEQTRAITEAGAYITGGKTVALKHSMEELQSAEYFSESNVAALVEHPQTSRTRVMSSRCNVHVLAADTISAAIAEDGTWPADSRRFHKPVLALNFANPVHPGGGVTRGASAQEEDICRKTTLYASLTSDGAASYYKDNSKSAGMLGSDAIVLSPCVEIVRNTESKLLDKSVSIAVLTCAAPYVPGLRDVTDNELSAAIRRRVDGILRIAVERGYDTLVLGAWGCGAFGNNPCMVADAFAAALREVSAVESGGNESGVQLNSPFSRICFAIPGVPGKSANYDAFERVLGDFDSILFPKNMMRPRGLRFRCL